MRSPHRFLEPIHNVKQQEPTNVGSRPVSRPDLSTLHPWISVSALGCVAALPRRLLSQACEHCVVAALCAAPLRNVGGAYRDRTDDLMLAKQPLSQLS
jgi:hypothetical protein